MKLKYNFVIKNVAGKPVALAVGKDSENFNGMIKLNSVGEFIFKELQNETTEETIVQHLLSEYDVEKDVAEESVKEYIAKLRDGGILSE